MVKGSISKNNSSLRHIFSSKVTSSAGKRFKIRTSMFLCLTVHKQTGFVQNINVLDKASSDQDEPKTRLYLLY